MDDAIDPERKARGEELFREILCMDVPPGTPTPLSAAVRNFGYAEVWSRPGLDRRSRRWITLACVTAAGSTNAMWAYAKSALDSGDITLDELREFALQVAVFQGFPKAVEFERIVNQLDAAK